MEVKYETVCDKYGGQYYYYMKIAAVGICAGIAAQAIDNYKNKPEHPQEIKIIIPAAHPLPK